MIRSIKIENVRGIGNRTFEFNEPPMTPNKVHILIAPNGFGKSSIATAFDNLNRARLSLKEIDCYEHDESKRPELTICLQVGSDTTLLVANQSVNTISKEFDTFVIKVPNKVKATQRPTASGHTYSVAEQIIEEIELCTIPEKHDFDYAPAKVRIAFGSCGKALPNISDSLECADKMNQFSRSSLGKKVLGRRDSARLTKIKDAINLLTGTNDEIVAKIDEDQTEGIKGFEYFREVCDIFHEYYAFGLRVLASLQLISLHAQNPKLIHKVSEWLAYNQNHNRVRTLLESCNPNPNWIKTNLKRTSGKVIFSLPKPNFMSNDQRDFLVFVAQLLEFELNSKRFRRILVIDEIFDYLDNSNIVACQYFLKKFIDASKLDGHEIYPLILTHLDPSVFNSFVFSKKVQRNHYLDRRDEVDRNGGLHKIIQKRASDPDVETIFAQHHAHYSLSECNEVDLFEAKGLKKTWGCSATFKRYCQDQARNYLRDDCSEVDFLAVCLCLRVTIEKLACDQLDNADMKSIFTSTMRGTLNKLDYAIENGAKVPELHYLLAGLYNTALHETNPNSDFASPVISKLMNFNIKQMIRSVLSE